MSTAPIRLVLVDDHAAFRQPFAFMLERERDLTVLAQAATLAEGRAVVADIPSLIDVAIIDLLLPDGQGIDLVRDVQAANPRSRSLVLTADSDRLLHARAIEAGAAGVMHKTAQMPEILDAIRRVHHHGAVHSVQEIMGLVQLASQERERERETQSTLARLTPRELEVLGALSEGLDNRAIADRLFISPETARTHVVKLLAKLNVESRLQAAIYAIEHGLSPVRRS